MRLGGGEEPLVAGTLADRARNFMVCVDVVFEERAVEPGCCFPTKGDLILDACRLLPLRREPCVGARSQDFSPPCRLAGTGSAPDAPAPCSSSTIRSAINSARLSRNSRIAGGRDGPLVSFGQIPAAKRRGCAMSISAPLLHDPWGLLARRGSSPFRLAATVGQQGDAPALLFLDRPQHCEPIGGHVPRRPPRDRRFGHRERRGTTSPACPCASSTAWGGVVLAPTGSQRTITTRPGISVVLHTIQRESAGRRTPWSANLSRLAGTPSE